MVPIIDETREEHSDIGLDECDVFRSERTRAVEGNSEIGGWEDRAEAGRKTGGPICVIQREDGAREENAGYV